MNNLQRPEEISRPEKFDYRLLVSICSWPASPEGEQLNSFPLVALSWQSDAKDFEALNSGFLMLDII